MKRDLFFFHHLLLKHLTNGGADRVRTDDLHNAIVALFQLSYGPNQIILLQETKRRSTPPPCKGSEIKPVVVEEDG